MKKYLIILFIIYGTIYPQINVTLPNYSGTVGESVILPISVSDLSGYNITALQFRLYYNKDVMKINGVDLTNSIIKENLFVTYDTLNGRFNAAWASAFPVQGSGVLFNIKLRISGLGISDLTTIENDQQTFLFNADRSLANVIVGKIEGLSVSSLEDETGIPKDFSLEQNYPNPFNPSTNISFSIPSAGNVTLKVFDSLGREVKTILNEYRNSGRYNLEFSAENMASGNYILSLLWNGKNISKKILLVK